jgi:hypothetical protein
MGATRAVLPLALLPLTCLQMWFLPTFPPVRAPDSSQTLPSPRSASSTAAPPARRSRRPRTSTRARPTAAAPSPAATRCRAATRARGAATRTTGTTRACAAARPCSSSARRATSSAASAARRTRRARRVSRSGPCARPRSGGCGSWCAGFGGERSFGSCFCLRAGVGRNVCLRLEALGGWQRPQSAPAAAARAQEEEEAKERAKADKRKAETQARRARPLGASLALSGGALREVAHPGARP